MSIAIDLKFLESEVKVPQGQPVVAGLRVDPGLEAVSGQLGVVLDGCDVTADQVVVVDVQSSVFILLVVQEHGARSPGLRAHSRS